MKKEEDLVIPFKLHFHSLRFVAGGVPGFLGVEEGLAGFVFGLDEEES